MPTNLYINNYNNNPEQRLIEDLIIEAIKMYGIDVYWLPRTLVNKDDLYGEDQLSQFNVAVPIEFYVKDVDGFGGEQQFLSRFGIQIKNEMTFTVAQRRFTETIQNYEKDQTRPYEGDLIWYPLSSNVTGALFEIKFVNNESLFYPLGSLPVYDLVCESFAYSNEIINTGLEEVDRIYTDIAVPEYMDDSLPTRAGDDNDIIQAEANTTLVTPVDNPFGDW